MRLSLCNLPIMPALCPMLLITYYASNYAGIIGLSLILQYVAKVVRLGRIFVRRLIQVMSSVKGRDHFIRLGVEAIDLT